MSEEIILERCIVCGWTGCDIDHKKDRKTMDFIESCRKVHGYRLGYENTVYVRCSDKVIINCSIHGDFEQIANGHKKGSACKACSGKCPKTAEKNFIDRIIELGGKVIGKYRTCDTPVECKCALGHDCNPSPCNVKKDGIGMCRICAGNDSKTAEKNFRDKIQEIGGEVKGKYIKSINPLECKCPLGHICYPRPNDVQQGQGMCIVCAGKCSKNAEKNFRDRIHLLGGEVKGEYTGKDNPIECKCPLGHICYPSPSTMRQQQGMCRICAGNDPKTSEQNFRNKIIECKGELIGEYIRSGTPVECKCEKGHICNIRPGNIINLYHIPCKICAGLDPKIAEANFIFNITELGGEVIGEYINSKSKVLCICKNEHICYPDPSHISQGRNMCLTCSQNGYSQAQISWLNYIQDEEKINIRHAENGGEFKIGKYKVDGYCEDTKTVYEFHGDFWHGNPKFYEHTDTNPVNKKTFGELLKATLHKEMSIRRSGYNYICIWEYEWNLMK